MRMRGWLAVGAGVAGAALAHALDEAGLLPGVREAASVRHGLSTPATVAWLGIAASLSWLGGRWGPIRIGAPASLLVAAVPELVGRHDPGAILEPGALAGAMLQWLLLLAVVAAAVIASRTPLAVLVPLFGAIAWPAPAGRVPRVRGQVIGHRGRPRAPPALPLSVRSV